jgi:hypothetical protein
MTILCSTISDTVSQFFSCEGKGDFTMIQTPFLYPDGDYISLYVESQQDGMLTVSDLGETVRWLRSNTPTLKRTPRQNLIIQDICLTHDVEFSNGVLQVTGLHESEVSETMLRVSQAIIRVSDIWLTFRNRTIQSTAEDVSEYFNEKAIEYDRNKKETGMSGRTWTVDFYSKTAQKNSFISVLSSGSRQAAKSSVTQAFTCFYDIRHATRSDALTRSFVSLVDDQNDVWEEADFKLLSEVSDVAFWTEPEKILATIGA